MSPINSSSGRYFTLERVLARDIEKLLEFHLFDFVKFAKKVLGLILSLYRIAETNFS